MKKSFLVLLGMLLVVVISSCGVLLDPTDFYSPPSDYIDETEFVLQEQFDTIQDGYAFAETRVNGWAKHSKLRQVVVVFIDDQIEDQRGIVDYIFTADDGKAKCLAKATVRIDMQTNVSPVFTAWFDVRTYSRRNKDGYFDGWETLSQTDISQWRLTLDEAFDIIYQTVGRDAFSRFEAPKINLLCFSDEWLFEVVKESERSLYATAKHCISINPITKEVIEIMGFEDDEV